MGGGIYFLLKPEGSLFFFKKSHYIPPNLTNKLPVTAWVEPFITTGPFWKKTYIPSTLSVSLKSSSNQINPPFIIHGKYICYRKH